MPNGTQQYTKLENRLVLLAWLNRQLGYTQNSDLLADMSRAEEGFDDSGLSRFYHRLFSRGGRVIPAEDLARYDENIRRHLERINRSRQLHGEPITLRYFQYLAALYTEILLDRIFNRRTQFLQELNAFVQRRNAAKRPDEPQEEPFGESDLRKLAYWMATGSGKTLLMHLNYHQFLHYNREPLDNILLVTPNEGLSQQHLEELRASGIPAERFNPDGGGRFVYEENLVQVIEITKLVERKRGGGLSVPVEAFEGRNLILVDEGHKGTGGEAWRKYREALGEAGFTFEYSATFGQALSAARNDPLTAEYGRTIVFDYSYRYFYGDGYGKDFRILNLREDTDEEKTQLLLLGNLLSFYEQQRLFEEKAEELRPYNLEKPLWVFVGSTVNAVYREKGQKRSDVLTVARFLHRVLRDRDWAVEGLKRILEGKSGLVTPAGTDVFAGHFPYLRELSMGPDSLYADILARVFHAPAGGGLHLAEIRSAPGELGLKAFGARDYFGVIYIGDTAEFKGLVQADGAGITLEGDAIADSLFEEINRPDSRINILIGARKFMEGWNSWRVSNMGLLNIGRQEGSQIIQLFGRGVRLRGRDNTLKRSAALDGPHPKHIGLLEILNIFSVRANYMGQFREYLEREGVETEERVELPLKIQVNESFLQRGLVLPRPEEGRDFVRETVFFLEPDSSVRVHVDLSTKVTAIESSKQGVQTAQVRGGDEGKRKLPEEILALVDWEQAYLDLLAYKERKGFGNLIIRPGTLREILEQGKYTLIADEEVFRPKSFAHLARIQEAVTALLRKYVDAFYRSKREGWEGQNLVYRPLEGNDPNLTFRPPGVQEKKGVYTIRVPRSLSDVLEAIERLTQDVQRLLKEEEGKLPRIHFDRHIYLPLLLKEKDISIEPPPLEESEARFVRDLKAYWEAEKDGALKGKEIFLLRNLSRGKGVGFFEGRGFYPDFILWIVEGQRQRIVFIEPHGMLHAKAYTHDEKARLHERLPELAKKIEERTGRQGITLDSYIISATPYDALRENYGDGKWSREEFTEKHILFPDRSGEYDYIKIILGT